MELSIHFRVPYIDTQHGIYETKYFKTIMNAFLSEVCSKYD